LSQDEVAFQTPSLPMDQGSTNLNAFTGRTNSSCSSNLPAAMPMPTAKPAQQQETEQSAKSAPSANRRKDQLAALVSFLYLTLFSAHFSWDGLRKGVFRMGHTLTTSVVFFLQFRST
jgi:hypothetical protein